MKKIATKLEDFYLLPNPGLRAFLSRNVKGQPDDYETGLFKGKTLEQILDGFKVKDSIPGLLDFETSMRGKVGPMSVMVPFSERQEKVEEYYTRSQVEAAPISEEAIQATVEEWKGISGVRALSRKNTLQEMRLSTNSGSPFFTKRKLVTNNEAQAKQFLPAATLGWRGQEGGPEPDDVKQRVVWMFPFELNVHELSVYKPIIKALQAHKLVPALIDMDHVDDCMTKLFDTKSPDDLVIGTDFSGYDQSFGIEPQKAVEQIWERLGVPGEWLRDIYPQKFSIPIVCTEEVTYTGDHGMASGSGGTNTDECAEHRALQHETALLAGSRLNLYSQAYGDDGVISYPGITLDHVIKSYTSHGHEMNDTKQYVSETATTFLRRYYHTSWRPDGKMRGVYSIYRALGRLRKQERYYDPDKWNATLVVLRSLSIIENCRWHPQFIELIEYVLTGDKYRLGLSVAGFFDRRTLSRLAKEAQDVMGDDFLGYVKNQQYKQSDAGINDWAVVQYLRNRK